MNQRKLLVLGESLSSEEIIRHARAQGIHTIVTDYHPPGVSSTKLLADEYWMIDTSHIDELEQKCRQEGIDALICGVSEFNQDIIIELSGRLNLPCYCTPRAWHFNRDKAAFKGICRELGLNVPRDYALTDALSSEELARIRYPVVVKPVDGSANRGMSYCHNRQQLIEGYRHAREVSTKPNVIVERMLHGREWMAYYALCDGRATLLSAYCSYTDRDAPAQCYSFNVNIGRGMEEYLSDINPKAIRALEAMGCREGLCALQLFRDEDGSFYFIELTHRLIGDYMYHPIGKIRGFDCVEWMLNYAMKGRNDPGLLPKSQQRPLRACGASYMFWSAHAGTVAEIRGMELARNLPDATVHFLVKPGTTVAAYRPMVIVTFTAADVSELCRSVAALNRAVSVRDEHGQEMAIFYTQFDELKPIYEEHMKCGAEK